MFDAAEFSEAVTLDGNLYKLHIYWNTRGAFWSLDIADANSIPLVSGIKLITGFPMLIQHKESGLPPGQLLIVDPNQKTQYDEPGRFDFVSGRNLSLVYWGIA
jgi:hypothetical protein